jgi:apolipoprotein D and lipocalin family protein
MSTLPFPSGQQPPLEPLPLDERIRRAELRLIAREDNLRRRIDRLGRRLHEATRPKRFIAPAIGGVVALLAIGLLMRGRARPSLRSARGSAGIDAHAAHGIGTRSDVPWVRMLGLAWPLLPTAWRSRVNPTTAATVFSIGLPLLERLLAGQQHPPLPTVQQVDLARYAGTWHEIARLPESFEAACQGQPSAHYALRGDHIEVVNRCPGRAGRDRVSRGVARVVPDSGSAKLKVTMLPAWLQWLPFAWADYWVLYVDEGYDVALVGHPNRRHLWILSRSRSMRPEQLAALMQFAGELQFPVEHLQVAHPN